VRAANNQLSFSPSDVTAYLECEHLTQLELTVARGEIVTPHVEDAQAALIRRKGEEHERAYLDQLLADRGRIRWCSSRGSTRKTPFPSNEAQ